MSFSHHGRKLINFSHKFTLFWKMCQPNFWKDNLIFSSTVLVWYISEFVYQTMPLNPLSFSVSIWSVAIFGIFFGLYGLYPALQGWDSIAWRAYHLVYGAFHRDIFSIGVAFFIYICHTGIGGPVNVFLSSNFFLPLANLSFSVSIFSNLRWWKALTFKSGDQKTLLWKTTSLMCFNNISLQAYLFHMIPVVLTYMLVPFPIYFNSQIPLFIHCFVQLLITYVFAVICSMVSELPALNIERLLLSAPPKTTLKPLPATDSELQLKSSEKA